MVPGLNPVKLLVKLPVPIPSFVELFAVVGFCDVLQQTPRCVTELPPVALMEPPLDAEELIIFAIGKVVMVAKLPGLFIV